MRISSVFSLTKLRGLLLVQLVNSVSDPFCSSVSAGRVRTGPGCEVDSVNVLSVF